jgi:hypothetical protein
MTFHDAAAMKTGVELYGVLQRGIQTLDRLTQYLARAAGFFAAAVPSG